MINPAKKVFLVSLIAIFGSCNKDIVNPNSPGSNTRVKEINTSGSVSVSEIEPASGTVFTAVTITGSNFDTVKTNNIVKFNGVTATINSATSTQIVVNVPAGATTGTVTVTNGNSASAPNAFKVLHIVKDGSLTPPDTIIIRALAFDKSGTNTYAIKTSIFTNRYSVINYTKGKLTVLYNEPNDTTVTETNGNNHKYQYFLVNLVSDAEGNVYTSLRLSDTYTNQGISMVTFTSSVIKISPAGKATVFASKVNSQPFGPISSMAVDASDNLYVVNPANIVLGYASAVIDKISPAGVVTVVPNLNNFITKGSSYVAADRIGNVYVSGLVGSNQAIEKYTPQNIISIITIPQLSDIDAMFIIPSNNLIVSNPSAAIIINQANHASNGISLNYNGYGPFADSSGNVYVVNNSITKYSFK